MVNQLDPLTTQPITPSNADLSSRTNFLALQEQILAPLARAKASDTTPAAAAPAKVEGIWNNFDPQIASRWETTTDAFGGVTLRDGVSPTPGWSLGDSTVVAKCLKIDGLVRVKLVVTLGSKNLYGLSSLAVIAGFPEVIGEMGTASFVLPYPPHDTGHGGYAVGIQTVSSTTIDSGGNLTRRPLYYSGAGFLFGAQLSRTPSPVNPSGYNGRVPIAFLDTWNPGPPVYYAAVPGLPYGIQGDVFTLFMKYHTDA